MSNYISNAETNKVIRAALKEAFPGTKFGVRSGSGGFTTYITWTDGPTDAQVKEVAGTFCSGKGLDWTGDYTETGDSITPRAFEYKIHGKDEEGNPRIRKVEAGDTVYWGPRYIDTEREYSEEVQEAAAAKMEELTGISREHQVWSTDVSDEQAAPLRGFCGKTVTNHMWGGTPAPSVLRALCERIADARRDGEPEDFQDTDYAKGIRAKHLAAWEKEQDEKVLIEQGDHEIYEARNEATGEEEQGQRLEWSEDGTIAEISQESPEVPVSFEHDGLDEEETPALSALDNADFTLSPIEELHELKTTQRAAEALRAATRRPSGLTGNLSSNEFAEEYKAGQEWGELHGIPRVKLEVYTGRYEATRDGVSTHHKELELVKVIDARDYQAGPKVAWSTPVRRGEAPVVCIVDNAAGSQRVRIEPLSAWEGKRWSMYGGNVAGSYEFGRLLESLKILNGSYTGPVQIHDRNE